MFPFSESQPKRLTNPNVSAGNTVHSGGTDGASTTAATKRPLYDSLSSDAPSKVPKTKKSVGKKKQAVVEDSDFESESDAEPTIFTKWKRTKVQTSSFGSRYELIRHKK